jgi:Fur family ferric uptake transcriptional regulator
MTNAEELKNSGLKATLPRIKILEVFQKTAQRHMTAEDVFKMLLAEGSDVGLATVYRVLMQFEQAGILSRNHFETGKSVFELNEGKHHDHLVCMDCGRVEEFFDAAGAFAFAVRGVHEEALPVPHAPGRAAQVARRPVTRACPSPSGGAR